MPFCFMNKPMAIIEIPVVRIKPMIKKSVRIIIQPVILAYFNKKEATVMPMIPPDETVVFKIL